MGDASFEHCLKFVLRWEGGYVNDPADPGGATNKGVTQRVYDAWRRQARLPTRTVKDITDDEVGALYESGYWRPPRCDALQGGLDLVQFDTAVNMGVKRAIRTLQGCLGCSIDGDFGPTTLRMATSCDVPGTLKRYCDAREDYYRRLVAARPALAKFLDGWLNRLNSLRREVGLAVAGTTRGLVAPRDEVTERIPDLGEDERYDL